MNSSEVPSYILDLQKELHSNIDCLVNGPTSPSPKSFMTSDNNSNNNSSNETFISNSTINCTSPFTDDVNECTNNKYLLSPPMNTSSLLSNNEQDYVSSIESHSANDKLDDLEKNLSNVDNETSLYMRIFGKRKTLHKDLIIKFDNPESTLSSFKIIEDRFLSYMSGESELERKVRLRLDWYKELLLSEIEVLKRIKSKQKKSFNELTEDLIQHEKQIKKCGLFHILPTFRIQGWLRLLRAKLLRDISVYTISLFHLRYERACKVLIQFSARENDTNDTTQIPLSSYNEFCIMPELLMNRDEVLRKYHLKLQKMDKLCGRVIHSFKLLLPELECRSFQQRKTKLTELLQKYASTIITSSVIALLDKTTILKSWEEFVEWYVSRLTIIKELENEFSMLIEDERETEGRILSRWLHLIYSSSVTSDSKSSKVEDKKNIYMLSPTGIIGFIKYFAINIIGTTYSITINNQDALLSMIESLIFKRISKRIFRYPRISLHNQDVNWRRKCKLCKYIDPVTYGVPSDYLSGNKDNIIKQETKNQENILSYNNWMSKLKPYPSGTYGCEYAKSSKVLSQITSSVCPRDIIFNLFLTLKWLEYDAKDISGKYDQFIGADLMFPILVLVIINSDIPNMHLILHYLHNYSLIDRTGEASYYVTCLEASVAYISKIDIPAKIYEEHQYIAVEEGSEIIFKQNEDEDLTSSIRLLSIDGDLSMPNNDLVLEKLQEWLHEITIEEKNIDIKPYFF